MTEKRCSCAVHPLRTALAEPGADSFEAGVPAEVCGLAIRRERLIRERVVFGVVGCEAVGGGAGEGEGGEI